VEPASAAGAAGLVRLAGGGEVPAGLRFVVTVTGHGLKDTATALEGRQIVDTVIDADPDAAAEAAGLR
jgi:threonine synthase